MMNKKVLTLDDEPIASIYYTMKECNKKMGTIIREHRPLMDGNRYLTDKEVSQIMKVSRRTFRKVENQPQNLAGISECYDLTLYSFRR